MIIKGTEIEIPNDLVVPGDLRLWVTKITSLPDGLKVGGWLDLRNTKITSLPDDIQVGGFLYLADSQLIASEKTQLEWVVKGADMLQAFKEPTEMAIRLHKMLWKL